MKSEDSDHTVCTKGKKGKITVPRPFNFCLDRISRKNKNVVRTDDKENLFNYRPTLSKNNVKAVSKKSLTVPKPFKFQTSSMRPRKIETSLQTKETYRFRARPFRNVAPFVPKKSLKSLTQIKDICLLTEKRSIKRREFANNLNTRELEKHSLLQKAQISKLKEKEKQQLEFRKKTEFRANPIRTYKRIIIRPSKKPLTIPISPKFTSR